MLKLTATALLAASAAAETSFVTLGDWGKVDLEQKRVAAALADAASSVSAQFLVGLGDNFYEDGVASVEDEQWEKTYHAQYTDQYESLRMPWNMIVGNHDHHQNATAQVDYSLQQLDDYWRMPALYYSFTETLDDGQTAEFVMLDTVTLSPDFTASYFAEHDPAQLAGWAARLPELRAQADDQWQWLEGALAASEADWLFVAGHYPVYSAAEHGDTADLVENLLPLLQQYHVDAYLNGHDHVMQHLQQGDIHFLGSGAAAKLGAIEHRGEAELVWGEVRAGFMVHTIDGENMHVSVVGIDGETMHEYDQTRIAKS